jgi:lycopene cyclase domain-containing protein
VTYTQIGEFAVLVAILLDFFLLRTRLIARRVFWASYVIVMFFQLVTNWWLTSQKIVIYNPDAIIGLRVASAPIEDLLFGFALILSVLSLWVFLGRKGLQRR